MAMLCRHAHKWPHPFMTSPPPGSSFSSMEWRKLPPIFQRYEYNEHRARVKREEHQQSDAVTQQELSFKFQRPFDWQATTLRNTYEDEIDEEDEGCGQGAAADTAARDVVPNDNGGTTMSQEVGSEDAVGVAYCAAVNEMISRVASLSLYQGRSFSNSGLRYSPSVQSKQALIAMCCDTDSTSASIFGQRSDRTARGFSLTVQLSFCDRGLPCITVRLYIIEDSQCPATPANIVQAEAAGKLHTITAQFSSRHGHTTGNGSVSNLECYHGDILFTDEMQRMQDIASGSKDNDEVLVHFKWDTDGASLTRTSGGFTMTNEQYERFRADRHPKVLSTYLDLFEKGLTCPGTIKMILVHEKTPEWTDADLRKMVRIFGGKDFEESGIKAFSKRTRRHQKYWTVVGVQLMLTVAVIALYSALYSRFGGMGKSPGGRVTSMMRRPEHGDCLGIRTGNQAELYCSVLPLAL